MLTRDDVIRMAREAGAEFRADTIIVNGKDADDFMVAFANLVAAAERKTCNVACAQAIEYAKGAEREACAELCHQLAGLMRSGKCGDELTDKLFDLQAKTGDDLAAIIRARGDKGAR